VVVISGTAAAEKGLSAIVKWLKHLFHLPQKHRAALGFTGVQTILKSRPLAAVYAWPIGWQHAVVQIGQVFQHRFQHQSAAEEPLVDRARRWAHQAQRLVLPAGVAPPWAASRHLIARCRISGPPRNKNRSARSPCFRP
jgi:hypothetical protein